MADRAPGTCVYCAKPTRSEATPYCNGCYELRVRMGSDLDRATRIWLDLTQPARDAALLEECRIAAAHPNALLDELLRIADANGGAIPTSGVGLPPLKWKKADA